MTTLLQESAIPTTSLSATLPARTQRVVLTGFMGAGKTTVGRLLAAELDWAFVDADAEVERATGRKVADIFAAHGEEHFRRLESQAIAKALGQRNAVIALGGGAPEILTNRLLLEQTPGTAVVFLDAPFEILFDRCVLQEGATVRPVLTNPEEAAERFRRRAPLYLRCAHHRVLTADQSPRDTALAVLHLLARN